MADGEAILTVDGLTVDAQPRRGPPITIVNDVSFVIKPGRVTALIGESGSGKTTISLACMGYARPGCRVSGGRVMLDGTSVLELDFAERRRMRGADVSYVAQSAAASFNGALRVNAQVTETPVIKGLLTESAALEKAVGLYRELDLPDPDNIGRRYPHQVSGGQLQRLMAAMAMICDPKLLILDEPTTALDVTTQIEVLQAFKRLIRDRHTSAIYVSHDLAVVAQMADDILVLRDGCMVEYGPVEQVIHDPQAEYTRMLISAAHVMPNELPVASRAGAEKDGALLEVENVSAGYGRAPVAKALDMVSVRAEEGRTLGIIGESGSGKTTLGRVIAGLMGPLTGEVRLGGEVLAPDIAQRPREQQRGIQFAFQMADVALNPRHRLRKILGRPLKFYFGLSDAEANTRVRELLELVELPGDFDMRFPRELSGGQRQRVNLARCLAAEPRLIICDEITSALDTIVAEAILELLRDLQERLKLSYIFISHDISTIAKVADSIAVMKNGEIVEYGPMEEVLQPPHHDYTDLLLDSVPELRTDWLDDVAARRV